MFAAAVPFPVSPPLAAGRGSLVASACRAVLVETSFRAHVRRSAPPAVRRSIAADAFLMAAINRVDSLGRRQDRQRLTLEQREIAAQLLERAQGPTMAIRGKVPLLFSWRENDRG